MAFCFTCCDSDSDSSDIERNTPLLSRSSPMPRPARTYGKKKSNTGTATTCAIFGREPSPSRSKSVRNPLSDVTSQLSNLAVQQKVDAGDHDRTSSYGSEDEALRASQSGTADHHRQKYDRIDVSNPSSPRLSSNFTNESDLDSGDESDDHLSADDIALQPLTDTYRSDRGRRLPITDWEDLIPHEAQVEKIAEASYAEVYRVSINGQSSILKLMQLQIPSDRSSWNSETAIDIETVASEVRLMNALTESPGFVTFKEAHLVRGRPSNLVFRAYHRCTKWNAATSLFPDPDTFTSSSLFLAIELGDAGSALDETPLTNISQVWDVFLGVVVSLAIAEHFFEFEHRDLHESNICVASGESIAVTSSNSDLKYGLSGLEVTILDYGLSRATLSNGDQVFNDLENDLGIFHGSPGNPQFDTYRRMRTHLFTGVRTMYKRNWHDDDSRQLNNGHTWREFRPYSNVLWIKYLLGYVKKNFKDSDGDKKELAKFEQETKDMKKRLDPRTHTSNGGFSSAGEIFEYVAQQRWISAEQVAAMGESMSLLSNSRVED